MTSLATATEGQSAQPFRHEALLYASDEEFVAGTVKFIRNGLAAGESVLVVVNRNKIERIRDELAGAGRDVQFADMETVGANPARIIPIWREFIGEGSARGQPVRGIGEPIWPGRSGDELVECQRHESLLNLAFTDIPAFRLLCPYDAEKLASGVIDEAMRSHPHIVRGAASRESASYRGLESIAEPFVEPLPEPPSGVSELAFDANALATLRAFVSEQAASAGIDLERAYDFVLAANEIASNSVRHAGGGGNLRIWQTCDAIVCEIRDCGCITKPLAGRERPAPDECGGWGLWLANQLCDLVQVRAFTDRGVVRLHMRRADSSR